jgi:alkylation response protein AidB-like acyl-CoA dehydrogenase
VAVAEETRGILDVAGRLTRDVLHPAERELDGLPDPDALAAHPRYLGALDTARAMGIHATTVDAAGGGLGAGWDVAVLATQAVADGAPGFAAQLFAEGLLATVVPELPSLDGGGAPARCWAVVQPGGGAAGALRLPGALSFRSARHRTDAAGLGTLTADGAATHARGVRLPQVANGDQARQLLVVVGDADGGARTHLVDLAGPGVVRAHRSRRTGLRVHGHADVVLADVVLDGTTAVLDGPASARLLDVVLTANTLGVVAVALGIAGNAHAYALDYCRTRVQGGKPIIEHQSVAWTLWRAEAAIAATRLALDAAVGPGGALPDLRTAVAVRTQAVEMVGRVTIDMLELLGGYGVTTEYHTEKLYRDARVVGVPHGAIEGPGVDAPVSFL